MQPEQHPAADLIDEARFMRRMAKVVEVSAEKVEQLAAAVRPGPPAGLTRLEVPTLNAEGWTPALLYVVRSERAKATPLAGIASMLEWMFRAEVTPQVLLAAIMHFDLDRRQEAPVPAELQAVQVVQEQQQEDPAEPVADQPCDTSPVVAHEAAPVEDKPDAAPAWPCPNDPAVNEPWAQKALAMHAEGEPPFRIARALKWHGATDFKVRCLLIPGFREQTRDKINAARSHNAKPRNSTPAAAPPKPRPRESETKPTRETVRTPARKREIERSAASKALPDPLPWTPPARVSTGCNAEIPAPGKGLHLTDLQHDHCRWLMGPGADGHETYCGCQKSRHGSSYCDAHAVQAFTEWPPRTPLKRPTRMARAVSALPAARNRQHERTA